MKVHEVAELFPLMGEEELDDLAESIKEHGLINAIVVDKEGTLIDGRNRLEACRRAGIEPRYETLNGMEVGAFILAQNVERRNLSAGQRAMAVAFVYPEPEKGGRGKKKTVEISSTFSDKRLQQARQVLRHSRELGMRVMRDTIKLDEALGKVKEEKERSESSEEKLRKLREEAPDLADLIAEGRLNLEEAYASYERRKKEAEESEKSLRETLMRLGESAYRGASAWANEGFCQDMEERVKDEEFRRAFIERVRLDRARIKEVVEGARRLVVILNKL